MRKDAVTNQVYEYIQVYFHEHGFAPSLRDISEGCYMSPSNVVRYLDKLEAQGRRFAVFFPIDNPRIYGKIIGKMHSIRPHFFQTFSHETCSGPGRRRKIQSWREEKE